MSTPNFDLTPQSTVEPMADPVVDSPQLELVNSQLDGKNRKGIELNKIIDRLLEATGNWPRIIGGKMYVLADENRLQLLEKQEGLFAWLRLRFSVDWADARGTTTSKAEFFEALKLRCIKYRGREIYPHYPPIEGVFYATAEYDHSNGERLQEFVNFFSPSTAEDTQLIIAMLLTLFWGGSGGQRPAILITSDESNERQGRGTGKTILANLAAELCGGYSGISQTESIERIKTRLLSSADPDNVSRVILLDNLKTHRFSWAEIEALITAADVSGHAMFRGDERRLNLFTLIMTINGASLSKDLAERTVTIKLKRPVYRAGWLEEVKAFMADYKNEIIGDILRMLQTTGVDLPDEGTTRWGYWEKAVLSKIEQPEKVRKTIVSRQTEIDDDKNESESFADFLIDRSAYSGFSFVPECNGVFRITQEQMHKLFNDFSGTKVGRNVVAKRINAYGLECLRQVGDKGRTKTWVFRSDRKKLTRRDLKGPPHKTSGNCD
jgi:hypothetical protein